MVGLPELLSREIGDFSLPGGDGVLREYQGVYSIRIRSSGKIIPLGKADGARIAFSGPAGNRALVIVEKTTRTCGLRYQVISIRGADIEAWELGRCGDRAGIDRSGGDVLITFAEAAKPYGYVFRDDRLYHRRMAAATPDFAKPSSAAMPSGPASRMPGASHGASGSPPALLVERMSGMPRYVPAPPRPVSTADAQVPVKPSAPRVPAPAPIREKESPRRVPALVFTDAPVQPAKINLLDK